VFAVAKGLACTSDASSLFCAECTDGVAGNDLSLLITDLDDKTCGGLAGAALTACLDAAVNFGWYIELNPTAGSFFSERVITDPLVAPIGAVFFTSFGPSSDICEYGGSSFLWAVNFETGGSVAGQLSGKGLLQVSTGAIEEVNFKDAFTQAGGRKTVSLSGVPPLGQGLNIVVPPQAIDKMMHIRKK
jgi:type IV pilus assembly protein PilY1